MNENNKIALESHTWLLGNKLEWVKQNFPNNPKIDKLIRIAQVLDKYQKEINYYQTRIRNVLKVIAKKKKNHKINNIWQI